MIMQGLQDLQGLSQSLLYQTGWPIQPKSHHHPPIYETGWEPTLQNLQSLRLTSPAPPASQSVGRATHRYTPITGQT
jgi:hypothetical protein